MTQGTHNTLFLLGELIAAIRANDPCLFKSWLSGGGQDLGEPAVTELLLDWLGLVPDRRRAGQAGWVGSWESATNKMVDMDALVNLMRYLRDSPLRL